VRPFSELATDLARGTVAPYNFITPNLCDDMHGSDIFAGDSKCLPVVTDLTKAGDDWLKANVKTIMDSAAYKDGGAIFILWDEGELSLSDGPIGFIAVSPFVKTGGYSNSIPYTHSSTLRTLQEIFGVTPFLRDAAKATDLSDLFTAFP
jgi:hypothetical protein